MIGLKPSGYEQEQKWNPKNVTPSLVLSLPYKGRSLHINDICQKPGTDGATIEI